MKVLHTYYAPKGIMDDCQRFAKEFLIEKLEYYKEKRFQGDPKKIAEDAYYGKLVEWGVYDYVKSLSLDVSKPGMVVIKSAETPEEKEKREKENREKERASYAADLTTGSYPFHVKGSPDYRLPNPSWVFQKNDTGLVYRPSSLDIIGLGIYYVDTNPVKIEIIKFFRAIYAVDYYDELLKKELNNSKVALYWEGKFDGKREVSRIEDFDFNMLIEMYGKVQ